MSTAALTAGCWSQAKGGGPGAESLVGLTMTEQGIAIGKLLRDFYGFADDFPVSTAAALGAAHELLQLNQILSRSANMKQLCYVSSATMELLKADDRHR